MYRIPTGLQWWVLGKRFRVTVFIQEYLKSERESNFCSYIYVLCFLCSSVIAADSHSRLEAKLLDLRKSGKYTRILTNCGAVPCVRKVPDGNLDGFPGWKVKAKQSRKRKPQAGGQPPAKKRKPAKPKKKKGLAPKKQWKPSSYKRLEEAVDDSFDLRPGAGALTTDLTHGSAIRF
jgi:hypothetical protein